MTWQETLERHVLLYVHGRHRDTPELEKLLARFELGQCWIWTRYTTGGGYPYTYNIHGVRVSGVNALVDAFAPYLDVKRHRGFRMYRSCANRLCIRPTHVVRHQPPYVPRPAPRCDWDAVKAEVLAGSKVQDVAARHGINYTSINTRIRKEGWPIPPRSHNVDHVHAWYLWQEGSSYRQMADALNMRVGSVYNLARRFREGFIPDGVRAQSTPDINLEHNPWDRYDNCGKCGAEFGRPCYNLARTGDIHLQMPHVTRKQRPGGIDATQRQTATADV